MIAEALAALALLAAPAGPVRLPDRAPATLPFDPAALPGGPFEVQVQHDPPPTDTLLVALTRDAEDPVAITLVLRPALDREETAGPVAVLGLTGWLEAERIEDRHELMLALYSPGRAADLFVTTADPDLSRTALVAAVDHLLRAALVPN